MSHKILLLLSAGLLMTLPAIASDDTRDGRADRLGRGSDLSPRVDGTIAIVDTGESTVTVLRERLAALGNLAALIPMESDLSVLGGYDLVCLPVRHGMADHNANFATRASDYHAYVAAGGALWIGQPAPYQMLDETTVVSWAPYALTVHNDFEDEDCPATIVAEHCLTEGLVAGDMPFPADTAISYSDAWQVLVEGGVTGHPAVMFATYGEGKVLVDLGHPATTATCSPSDACLTRFMECMLDELVPVEKPSWSELKDEFRQ